MRAGRKLAGEVRFPRCICPNGACPVNGLITYSVNCPVHRLTPLYEQNAATPLDHGWRTTKKGHE